MTPEQALNVIAQVAAAHLCNKQDRLVIDQAIESLASLIKANQPTT
jgi:hypothetical protein